MARQEGKQNVCKDEQALLASASTRNKVVRSKKANNTIFLRGVKYSKIYIIMLCYNCYYYDDDPQCSSVYSCERISSVHIGVFLKKKKKKLSCTTTVNNNRGAQGNHTIFAYDRRISFPGWYDTRINDNRTLLLPAKHLHRLLFPFIFLLKKKKKNSQERILEPTQKFLMLRKHVKLLTKVALL